MAEVLMPAPPHENRQYLSPSPLLHNSHSQSSHFLGHSPNYSINPSPGPASPFPDVPPNSPLRTSHSQPLLQCPTSSFDTLSRGTLSLNTYLPEVNNDEEEEEEEEEEEDDDDEEDEELSFPAYGAANFSTTHQTMSSLYHSEPDVGIESNVPTPDISTPIEDADAIINPIVDDMDLRQQPSRQVDYLSHDWKEEDIWSSWRHLVTRRKVYGEQPRLENASWRTWTKQKYGLRTVSPETLNWLKDYDVTWLYGPLQEAPRPRRSSEPSSRLSKNASFLNKKPILKKRSVSEEMLQKSISSSSLVKQAAAAVQAQRSGFARTQPQPSNRLRRCASDFDGTTTYTESNSTANISSTLTSSTSSGVMSPDLSGRKRIRFDNNVEQCIAVDFKEGGGEEEVTPEWMNACSDEESDDDLPTLKTRSRLRPSRTSSSRNSISSESKGIVKLPSTTLKFHHDEPDCQGHPTSQFSVRLRSPALSPSPSVETLKPSAQSSRFLLGSQDENDSDADPAKPHSRSPREGTYSAPQRDFSATGSEEEEEEEEEEATLTRNGMRRTPSGMFMPFEEGEDDDMVSHGIIGRVVDTVNTARDICYVLYNVGWRQ